MIRTGKDVQLDNVARTVICNNVADIHIALHWDGDGLKYDKGCFYIGVPDKLKTMKPVKNSLGNSMKRLENALIKGLKKHKVKINGKGPYGNRPHADILQHDSAVDIELGNQASDHSDEALEKTCRWIDCRSEKNSQKKYL